MFQFYNVTYYGYILAGIEHVLFLLFFLGIGLMPMVYFNFISISTFFIALLLVNKNKVNLAFIIVVIEVLIHAFLSIYFLGFNSGFQFYLFALAPIIFFNPKWSFKSKVSFVLFLSLFMIFLRTYWYVGSAHELHSTYLIDFAFYFNVIASFAMFSLIAYYYKNAVIESRNELINKNKELSEKNNQISNQIIELAQLNSKLEDVNNSKDKFFSIIAHDLKNPLAALFLNTELLSQYFDRFDPIQVKDKIYKLHDSSKQLKALLDNLLEWSRSQTGSIEYEPETLALKSIIMSNLSLIDMNIKSKSIKIELNNIEEVMVFADKNMLNTIIRNLLTNAVKFTDYGGRISLSSNNTDDMFTIIEIEDNGVGIHPDKINFLFRLDKSKSTPGTLNEQGTGLGLILCKEFIEKHNGRIDVESTLGIGSKFRIVFPK